MMIDNGIVHKSTITSTETRCKVAQIRHITAFLHLTLWLQVWRFQDHSRNCRKISQKCGDQISPSWWLNQPIWKMCSSNWDHFPNGGWKIKQKYWNHHLVSQLLTNKMLWQPRKTPTSGPLNSTGPPCWRRCSARWEGQKTRPALRSTSHVF